MRRGTFVLTLLLSSCNSGSPTAPTPPVGTTPPPVVTPLPPPPAPTITNYAGRWFGGYVVEQCAGSSGSMDDVLCSAPRAGNSGGIFQRGVSLPVSLDLSQNGSAVNGTLSLGQIRGTVSGSVLSNQSLVLSGAPIYSDATTGLTITNTITNWDTSLTSGIMNGTFTFTVRVNIFPGDGTVRVRLSDVRR